MLRANAAINKAAKRVLSLCGHTDIAPVNSSCGAEQFCAQTNRPLMDEVRHFTDGLEGEVANELWPYSTYQEMLFIK